MQHRRNKRRKKVDDMSQHVPWILNKVYSTHCNLKIPLLEFLWKKFGSLKKVKIKREKNLIKFLIKKKKNQKIFFILILSKEIFEHSHQDLRRKKVFSSRENAFFSHCQFVHFDFSWFIIFTTFLEMLLIKRKWNVEKFEIISVKNFLWIIMNDKMREYRLIMRES